MYGSCCEEQEAKEAEVRSRLRAATAVNESRMMKGHLLRENMLRGTISAFSLPPGIRSISVE